MNQPKELMGKRVARMITVSVMSLMATLALAATPAQAITEMRVNMKMEIVAGGADGSPDGQTTLMTYDALLPTDTGWGYLQNGGSITVTCYGSDPFFDDTLFSTTHTISSTQPLWAGDLGIHLDGWRGEPPGGLFNEDPEGHDEVYCRLTWRDADGVTLERTTRTRSGNF